MRLGGILNKYGNIRCLCRKNGYLCYVKLTNKLTFLIMEFCKKHPLLTSIVVMFALIVVGGTSVLYWLDSYTHHGQALKVPDLYEMQVSDANILLKQEHLRCMVVDSVYKKGVRPGAIVDQVPDAGAKVKEGRIVFLTINATQEKQVLLPQIKDLSERQAKASIEGIGLKVEHVTLVASPYKGLVMGVMYRGEKIAAGDKLPIGSAVTLLVGKGKSE